MRHFYIFTCVIVMYDIAGFIANMGIFFSFDFLIAPIIYCNMQTDTFII